VSKDVTKVHTLHLTNGAMLVLYQVIKDVKWYTETLDLANACAISQLIEKRVPDMKKVGDIPASKQDAWLSVPKILKLNESMRDTAKKSIEHHSKSGSFSADGGNGVSVLLSEFGIQAIPEIDRLLADAEAEESAGAAPAAQAAAAANG
jgi:hypothetical protein